MSELMLPAALVANLFRDPGTVIEYGGVDYRVNPETRNLEQRQPKEPVTNRAQPLSPAIHDAIRNAISGGADMEHVRPAEPTRPLPRRAFDPTDLLTLPEAPVANQTQDAYGGVPADDLLPLPKMPWQ